MQIIIIKILFGCLKLPRSELSILLTVSLVLILAFFFKNGLKIHIKNKITKGPINGEQYFVEDSTNERLEVITTPDSWCTRWTSNEDVIYGKDMTEWQVKITQKYRELTGNPYIYLDKFHPDIKFVHFTHSINKPTEWKDYDKTK